MEDTRQPAAPHPLLGSPPPTTFIFTKKLTFFSTVVFFLPTNETLVALYLLCSPPSPCFCQLSLIRTFSSFVHFFDIFFATKTFSHNFTANFFKLGANFVDLYYANLSIFVHTEISQICIHSMKCFDHIHHSPVVICYSFLIHYYIILFALQFCFAF